MRIVGHRGGMTATTRAVETLDGLHGALLALARGRRDAIAAVYDESVEPVLRLALARTRGNRAEAEALLARTYCEVRRSAGDYPRSGLRALPWVLAVTARA